MLNKELAMLMSKNKIKHANSDKKVTWEMNDE